MVVTYVDNPLTYTKKKLIEIESTNTTDLQEELGLIWPFSISVDGRVEDYLEFNDSNFVVVVNEPNKGSERMLATLALAMATAWAGPFAAGALGLTSGSLSAVAVSTLVATSISYAGTQLINDKWPVEVDSQKRTELHNLTHTSNPIRKGGLLPYIVGETKFIPDTVSKPYVEYVDLDTYLHQIYGFGENWHTDFSNIQIDGVALEDLPDIEFEWSDTNGNINLFPANVDVAEGKRLEDLDDSVEMVTAENTTQIFIDAEIYSKVIDWEGFIPATQFTVEFNELDENGNETTWINFEADNDISNNWVVSGAGEWRESIQGWSFDGVYTFASPVGSGTYNVYYNANDPLRFTLSKAVAPGQYKIRVTRKDVKPNEDHLIRKLTVKQLRSNQPAGNNSLIKDQVRLAIKFKASGSLTGRVGLLTCTASAKINGLATSNPADWYLDVARTRGNVPDTRLNLSEIAAWRQFCVDEGLTINHTFTQEMSVGELLAKIARAGRAEISFGSGKLGVIYYQSNKPTSQVFNDENIIKDSLTVNYITRERVPGMELEYFDENSDFIQTTVSVGQLPRTRVSVEGITNKSHAWKELNLVWNINQHLKRTLSFKTNLQGLAVDKGDIISVSGCSLFDGNKTCRVIEVKHDTEDQVTVIAQEEIPELFVVPNEPPTITPGYSIFGNVGGDGTYNTPNAYNPGYNSGTSSISDIATTYSRVDNDVVLYLSWYNIGCTGAHITFSSTGGQLPSQTQTVIGNKTSIDIPNIEQLISMTFTPIVENKATKVTNHTFYYNPLNATTGNISSQVSIVRGLQIDDEFADPNGTEFTGNDCRIKWREVRSSAPEIGNESIEGMDSTIAESNFKDYEVKVYNHTGDLLRTEYTETANYIYTKEKNEHDNKPATRYLTFHVNARGHDNKVSSVPAKTNANNLPPATLSGLSIVPNFYAANVEHNTATDLDFVGIMIWMDTTSGFTPSGDNVGVGNCVIKSISSNPTISNLQTGTTYYVRVAAYDAFESSITDLNISSEYSFTTNEVVQDIDEVATDTLLKAHGIIDSTGLIGPQLVGDGSLAVDAVQPTNISTTTTDAVLKAHGVIDSTGKVGANGLTVDAVGPDNLDMDSIKVNSAAMNDMWAGIGSFNTIVADSAVVDGIKANMLDVNNLAADSGKMNDLWVGIGNFNTIVADSVIANGVTASSIGANQIVTQKANIANGIIDNAKIDELEVDTIWIKSGAVSNGSSANGGTLNIPLRSTAPTSSSSFTNVISTSISITDDPRVSGTQAAGAVHVAITVFYKTRTYPNVWTTARVTRTVGGVKTTVWGGYHFTNIINSTPNSQTLPDDYMLWSIAFKDTSTVVGTATYRLELYNDYVGPAQGANLYRVVKSNIKVEQVKT